LIGLLLLSATIQPEKVRKKPTKAQIHDIAFLKKNTILIKNVSFIVTSLHGHGILRQVVIF
jgi:hypothetical protein